MGKGGHSKWIIYTMGKGSHSIIPSGSYIQWEKLVIPSFHVDHIIYNGKRWSFHHSMWIIYNGKRWSFQVEHIQWEKVGHSKWNIYNRKR